MAITIDERGCGSGKTTGWGGIYDTLTKWILLDRYSVLVVVPSIRLQEQYRSDLSTRGVPVTVINSDDSGGVGDRITASMRDTTPRALVITHQAFLNMPPNGYRRNWRLIIDEAPEGVLEHIPVDMGGKPNIDLFTKNWRPHPEHQQWYDAKPDDSDRWIQLEWIGGDWNTSVMGVDWRTLTHPNRVIWITHSGWTKLSTWSGERVDIICELSPHILDDWDNIHCAGARWGVTKWGRWMNTHRITYGVVGPFEPHAGANIHIHSPDDSKLPPKWRWSITKLRSEPAILLQHWGQVLAGSGGSPVIALRNSECGTPPYTEVAPQPQHNSSGINHPNWMTTTHISLESALLPHPAIAGYLKVRWELDDRAITNMWCAYGFYQLIWRSKIRLDHDAPIHIWAIDPLVVLELIGYWDGRTSCLTNHPWELQLAPPQPIGRPTKLTPEERRERKLAAQRKWKAKQKSRADGDNGAY